MEVGKGHGRSSPAAPFRINQARWILCSISQAFTNRPPINPSLNKPNSSNLFVLDAHSAERRRSQSQKECGGARQQYEFADSLSAMAKPNFAERR